MRTEPHSTGATRARPSAGRPAHDFDRARRVKHNRMGHRPEQEPPHRSVSMCADHDEVGIPSLGLFHDRVFGRAFEHLGRDLPARSAQSRRCPLDDLWRVLSRLLQPIDMNERDRIGRIQDERDGGMDYRQHLD